MNEGHFFQSDQITPADDEPEVIEFKAEPYPDARRILVTFRLSYFQVPPNASIRLVDQQGETITSVDLVNIIHAENEITLHIPRSVDSAGEYQVILTLFNLEEQEAPAVGEGKVELTTRQLSTRKLSLSLP